MTERQRYVKPEVYEVLLDVSQAVLSACKSGVTSAKQGDRKGWCKNNCKMAKRRHRDRDDDDDARRGKKVGGANSRASS